MLQHNYVLEARERYGYIERLVTSDLPSSASVVELGAAPGDQIAHFASIGYRCTSVDIGEASDDWAGAEPGRMKQLLASAGVEDVIWDLEEVPYPLPSESFDAVIMTEVYEHLREYPITALKEVHRILRPGGRLYFTTPNQAYLPKRLRLLMGRNVQTPLHDWICGLPIARHAREYTFAEIHQLMSEVHLSIVRSESRHFYLQSGRQGAASLAKHALNVVAVRRPVLGPEIVVVAEKPARLFSEALQLALVRGISG